ncbi:unnamed protein product, partial [Schistocephalus solidus]
MHEDGRVDVSYTNLEKAFGSVPHKRLIYKLSEIGKGGPLLFLVFINDFVDDLGCSAIVFADDVKIWRASRSDAVRHALQENLNRLSSWSARWLLNWNEEKCVVLRLRTKTTSEEDDSFQYLCDGHPLSIVEEQQDLAKRKKQVVFAHRRGFVEIDKKLFRKTYGDFVRSQLEYALKAWRPWLMKDYLQLERVQARATKMVKNLSHLPYEARLAELDLFPLNYKKLRGQLIQAYRIARGRKCAPEFDDFLEFAGTEHLWGYPFKLPMKLVHKDVHRDAFSPRVVGAWK